MSSLDISLIGSVITTVSFLVVAGYAFIHRKELYRTTQHSNLISPAIITLSLVFALLNFYRFGNQEFGGHEVDVSRDLDLIIQYLGILVQSLLILVLFSSKIVSTPRVYTGRILAIGAHPDDIEIAAGAALSKMRDTGYEICGMIMSHGEKGGDGDTRPLEARKGAKFLGFDDMTILDFTDRHLSAKAVEVTEAIEAVLEKEKPDIIFTHSNHDLHQDHQVVHEATLRAARDIRTTILCYESPSVTQDFHPTYFIDVAKYVDIKIQAIHSHWDQHKKPYMKDDVVRGKLAFRGAQAKVDYAEGFEVVRMVSGI